MKKDLICIGCPLGCMLQVEMDGEKITVRGNTCKKGEEYGRNEWLRPVRIVTSSVPVDNGNVEVLPVKTEREIEKNKILDCIKELRNVRVNAPVEIGDIIVENICNTGVNIIATKRVSNISG